MTASGARPVRATGTFARGVRDLYTKYMKSVHRVYAKRMYNLAGDMVKAVPDWGGFFFTIRTATRVFKLCKRG